MKAFYWLMIPLLLSERAVAQADEGRYNLWTFGAGMFLHQGPARDFVSSFPYTITSMATGATASNTFRSTVKDSYFTSPLAMIDFANLELVRKRFAIDLGLGTFRGTRGGEHGIYVKTGYRRVLTLGPLVLKPGFDLYAFTGSKKMLGSIDNWQQAIGLFGYTAAGKFTVEHSTGDDDEDVETDTINAAKLNIDYKRTALLFEPKLEITTRPRGDWVFGIEAGWMLQLSQSADLVFTQTDADGNNSNHLGEVPVTPNAGFSGPYVSLNVSYEWGQQKRLRKAAHASPSTPR
jgi:hypothetical protein